MNINQLSKDVYRLMTPQWDDFPADGEHHGYIAVKLDGVVITACRALALYREGKRVNEEQLKYMKEHLEWFNKKTSTYFPMHFVEEAMGTEEYFLAYTLLLILNLMGFCGAIYGGDNDVNEDVDTAFRLIIRRCNDSALDMSSVRLKGRLVACVKSILHIADHNKIDIMWFLKALMKFMEESHG